jgi:hypothetical protein
VLLLGAACTGDGFPSRDYSREDLPLIVLQPDDAPVGTTYVDGESDYFTAEMIWRDPDEQDVIDAVNAAGFQDAFIASFFDPRLYELEDRLNPEGSLAFSYAVRFRTPAGAAEGLRVIKNNVSGDAGDLDERPTDGFGPDAFVLHGELDPDQPPGFLFAWRVGNVVQALVAVGARDAIREEAARTLAQRMLVYAGNPSAQASPEPTTAPSST